jgi:hypothetical protein
LIGPTDPRRNGPYLPPHRGASATEQVLFKPLPCSYCYKRYAEAKACLLNISPDEVVRRALAVLSSDFAERTAGGVQ